MQADRTYNGSGQKQCGRRSRVATASSVVTSNTDSGAHQSNGACTEGVEGSHRKYTRRSTKRMQADTRGECCSRCSGAARADHLSLHRCADARSCGYSTLRPAKLHALCAVGGTSGGRWVSPGVQKQLRSSTSRQGGAQEQVVCEWRRGRQQGAARGSALCIAAGYQLQLHPQPADYRYDCRYGTGERAGGRFTTYSRLEDEQGRTLSCRVSATIMTVSCSCCSRDSEVVSAGCRSGARGGRKRGTIGGDDRYGCAARAPVVHGAAPRGIPGAGSPSRIGGVVSK